MSVEKRLLEIHEWLGVGYRPCIDFAGWRVAILCYIDELAPDQIDAMERHNQTDEVFVLLNGRCILFIGDGDREIEDIQPVDMLPHKLYNVKKGVYHTHTLTRDAIVLIVENRDTSPLNSDRLLLRDEQRKALMTMTEELWAS